MSNLEEYVSKLESWVREAIPNCPQWKSVQVIKMDRKKGDFIGSPVSLMQFAKEFDELLKAGFSWINVSAGGKIGDALLVIIEAPLESVGAPSEKVSINFSGPLNLVSKNPDWQVNTKAKNIFDLGKK